MRTINREIVSAIIVSKDGKLLLGLKNPDGGGVYVDCWHIPGGGVDENETKKIALTREVAEETGIDISGYKTVLVDDNDEGESEKILKDTGEKVLCKMKFYVFRVDLTDKKAHEIVVKLGDDLFKTEWVNPEGLKYFKLTPPGEKLFRKLGYLK
jgi:8-oxo-dGTP pyrophosphatase MutT (NUDIX family)